uniref:Single Kunitz protease inhibitor n=1 Tax=Simulium nigrimanum TaxID=683695 RepID=D1FPW2_SIMNI
MKIVLVGSVFLVCLGYTWAAEDICKLPMNEGLCRALAKRYYYDSATRSCKQFYYGGCEGNANNFESKRECAEKCIKKPNGVLIKTRKRKNKKNKKQKESPLPEVINLDDE